MTCCVGRASINTSGGGRETERGSGFTIICIGEVRKQLGRDVQPSRFAVGEDDGKRGLHGHDGAKKISGRKRHILVDTTRLVISSVVHSAAVMDRDGAFFVLGAAYGVCERLTLIWANMGYRGARLTA